MTKSAKINSVAVWCFILSCFGTGWSQDRNSADFSKLDRYLQQEFASRFGFSVLIADARGVRFSKAYGSLDTTKSRAVDEQTLFNIASVTKSITAVGIFQLVEEGKLKLTDTLGVFFRHVPPDKRSITIGQLLSHKSGFKQNFICDGIANSADAQKALFADTLGSLPGTTFDYSNENFEILGLVIETVTHSTYEDFIRNHILIPLKMKNTLFWGEADQLPNVAGKNREIEAPMLKRNWGYIGSGGIYTTPTDLYRFISGVMHNKILSEQSRNQMLSEHLQTKSGLGVGYGWFINGTTDWSSKEIWTRGNEDWGHNAVIRWFPDRQSVIIVCTNSGEIAGDKQVTGNRLVSTYIADYLWKK